MNKRYYHWIKLQRRYRATQQRWAENQERHLKVKLDRIRRRLHRLNRSWRLGVSSAALTAWLMAMPGATANAQEFAPIIDLSSGLDVADGFKIFGENDDDRSGTSVNAIGDINGDGMDDVAIGASMADNNGNDSGTTYIVFGRKADNPFGSSGLNLADLDGTNGFKILGENAGDQSGTSVSNAGDVNSDGIDDLIIGAPRADNNGNDSGTTYVVFGRKADDLFGAELNLADLDGTNGFKILGENLSDRSGTSVSYAGDVNSDGTDDLLIGAPSADNNGYGSGTTYLVFGKEASDPFNAELNLADLDGSNGVKFLGENIYDASGSLRSGGSVSTAGDINGDGLDDFILGTLGYSGLSYVVFGRDASDTFGATFDLSNLDGINGFKIVLENTLGGYAGGRFSPVRDINGDGMDDLLVGAYGTDTNGRSSGTCYVLFGREESNPFSAAWNMADLNGTNGFKIQGENERDRVGISVSNAGDVNNDGIEDLLIGSTYNSGAAYVVFGRKESDAFSLEMTLSGLDGTDGFRIENNGNNFGRYVSTAGDINGDGIDDLITSAFLADDNGSNSGTTYMIFGKRKPTAPEVANALPDAQRVLEREAFSYQVPDNTFTDANPAGSFTLSAALPDGSALPIWLTFDAGTGMFSGIPQRTDTGTLTIRITATNEFGLTASDEFELMVNDLPILSDIGEQTVNAEESLTFTPTADNQIGTLAFSLDETSTGKGMTIDETSGAFSWTPTADEEGSNDVTLSVNDGEATDEKTFTITVTVEVEVSVPLGVDPEAPYVLTYPNPTHGLLNVEGQNGIHQAIVYSLSGRQILIREKVTNGTLDIGHLNAGTYLITFRKDGKVHSQARVVKIN